MPRPKPEYLSLPLTPEERARLAEVAAAHERDLVGEIRWRLRGVLRAKATRVGAHNADPQESTPVQGRGRDGG
jgi:hypothetical protein